MADPKADNFVFIDFETNGLDAATGYPLEVGFRITDLELNVVDNFSHVVYHQYIKDIRNDTVEFVQNMHDKNGLWEACANDDHYSIPELEEVLYEELLPYKGEILCGSSLKLDRAFFEYWFPEAAKLFHYRSIDNSSTKELCKRLNPALYAQLPESETDHRVNTCLDGTISEMKFYIDNFLFVGE